MKDIQPIFATEAIETSETCNTCRSLSNDDFMTGIFGEIASNERPVTVSFTGNPAEVSSGKWFGKPWIAGKTPLPPDSNNYVSFATYKPDQGGKHRRQKKHFAALHAVMLDDIGSKVPLDRISVEPSWMIETSKDNFQIGFILEQPITNPTEADLLLDAIIEAGLTDSGANGPCALLGRLPRAINGKYLNDDGSYWPCILRAWQPNRRYTVQALTEALEIDLKETSQERRSSKDISLIDRDHDDVHIPRANENPVIAALKESGRYKQPLGEGKHDITCPWLHEHTNQTDQGTAYFEPSESYPLGGFKCMHGHCVHRRVSALHEFLGVSKIAAKHKPIILVQAGEIPRIVDATEQELSKTLRHYQRGGVIVSITTDPGTKATMVKQLSLASLTRAVAGLAVWQRFDKRSDEWVTCDPPEKHVRFLHDASVYPHLPVLNGIARQPYLRPDGSLVSQSGYDFETGMFGVFSGKEFSIPSIPTRPEAEQALAVLSDLLGEFAFKSRNDLAAALSAILTATIRASLPQAPLFHCKAHSISSGKSYLCELFTAFATPQRGTPHAFPADDEECRKMLLAELLTAPAVIEFDNLTSDLIPHKSLCTALTSEFVSGRILGQSKTAEVNTRVLLLSSGNNVDPVRDMTRRTITISLDPACEIPAAREFNKQPVLEIRNNRGYFVSLALTIIRAWICAGHPKTECKNIATYTDWSNLCRHPLLWLGLPDPAASMFESMLEDPDREQLGHMLHGWHDRFGNEALMIRDALKRIGFDDEPLWDVINDIAGERDGIINRNRLGWWLKRHAGRVVDGLRFVKDDSSRGSVKWKVQVLQASQVSVASAPKNVTPLFTPTNAYAQASRGL
ncbi:death domain-containing protein [Methylomonas rhizoryzae]|uniref:death domain-containing protein n=1 Tax=Methylomonas rhizoryzae TaxID=2608981 RepID=UPI0016801084|nr:death domain-containing protein [Methylomonas rhizoryzae]